MPRDTHLTVLCHLQTLAPSTGLARGRQLSGLGQHLSPLPFSHINGVLSTACDIKGIKEVNEIDLRSDEHTTSTMLGNSCSNFVKDSILVLCTS